ncbi:Poly(A)-specific ribonuclease PARN [Diplonema papillatum]|nr:Poly(A)-specific ribonuclease PARN [Diplonema papillatum]
MLRRCAARLVQQLDILRVNCDNAGSAHDDFAESLVGASFAAVDTEFTGIPSRGWTRYAGPREVFDDYRRFAAEFLVTQVGVAVFRWDPVAREFTHRVFSVDVSPDIAANPLFPQPGRDASFRCTPASLKMLAAHSYDFSAWLTHGVSASDARRFWETLVGSKVKIVGFQCVLDILLCLQWLDRDGLPASVEQFLARVHDRFPGITDIREALRSTGSAKSLAQTFADACASAGASFLPAGTRHHNAGVDAFMTGVCYQYVCGDPGGKGFPEFPLDRWTDRLFIHGVPFAFEPCASPVVLPTREYYSRSVLVEAASEAVDLPSYFPDINPTEVCWLDYRKRALLTFSDSANALSAQRTCTARGWSVPPIIDDTPHRPVETIASPATVQQPSDQPSQPEEEAAKKEGGRAAGEGGGGDDIVLHIPAGPAGRAKRPNALSSLDSLKLALRRAGAGGLPAAEEARLRPAAGGRTQPPATPAPSSAGAAAAPRSQLRCGNRTSNPERDSATSGPGGGRGCGLFDNQTSCLAASAPEPPERRRSPNSFSTSPVPFAPDQYATPPTPEPVPAHTLTHAVSSKPGFASLYSKLYVHSAASGENLWKQRRKTRRCTLRVKAAKRAMRKRQDAARRRQEEREAALRRQSEMLEKGMRGYQAEADRLRKLLASERAQYTESVRMDAVGPATKQPPAAPPNDEPSGSSPPTTPHGALRTSAKMSGKWKPSGSPSNEVESKLAQLLSKRKATTSKERKGGLQLTAEPDASPAAAKQKWHSVGPVHGRPTPRLQLRREDETWEISQYNGPLNIVLHCKNLSDPFSVKYLEIRECKNLTVYFSGSLHALLAQDCKNLVVVVPAAVPYQMMYGTRADFPQNLNCTHLGGSLDDVRFTSLGDFGEVVASLPPTTTLSGCPNITPDGHGAYSIIPPSRR